MDREMVRFGPTADSLKRIPIGNAFLVRGGNPCAVRRRFGRDLPPPSLGSVQPALIEHRSRLPRSVMGDNCHFARGFHAAHIEEVITIPLRAEMRRGRPFQTAQKYILSQMVREHPQAQAATYPPAFLPDQMRALLGNVEDGSRVHVARTEIAIEQQMSAEWKPGWIASSVATIPPTGIVPKAMPAGQASGMIAPLTTVGTRINASICLITLAMLASSSAFAAAILMPKLSSPGARRPRGGGARISRLQA